MTAADIAIVGGGFSGTLVAANIIRTAQKPLSLALVSDEPENVFGPAYSTPRAEHLLNVQAANMGAFADDPAHFLNWLTQNGHDAHAGDFMPRMVYGRYLADIWAQTKQLAARKGITLSRITARVQDVDEAPNGYALSLSNADALSARTLVLATGNTLKHNDGDKDAASVVVRRPWHFDFSHLSPAHKNIAVIGSGLTAADTLISLLDAGWPMTDDARITVYSKSGLLPRAHLKNYDSKNLFPYRLEDFLDARPSCILRRLRQDIREKGVSWHYAIDGLRPLTQALWAQLSPQDKNRLRKKYFTLWNVHRHRYAPDIGRRIDAAIAQGRICFVRARVAGVSPASSGGVTLSFAQLPPAQADIAFECMGVEYRILDMPLYKNMATKGLVTVLPPAGIAVDENFVTHGAGRQAIYALGTPLIGQLFETTAVPELRVQAQAVARRICAHLT